MLKQAVFTMKLEAELRDEFLAEVQAAHRPASQVVRDLMREFVQRQRDARDYAEFLQRKVEKARQSIRTSPGYSNDEIEAEFSKLRVELLRKTDASEAWMSAGHPMPGETVSTR